LPSHGNFQDLHDHLKINPNRTTTPSQCEGASPFPLPHRLRKRAAKKKRSQGSRARHAL